MNQSYDPRRMFWAGLSVMFILIGIAAVLSVFITVLLVGVFITLQLVGMGTYSPICTYSSGTVKYLHWW